MKGNVVWRSKQGPRRPLVLWHGRRLKGPKVHEKLYFGKEYINIHVDLRTVPTFVSARTSCASLKAWFKPGRLYVARPFSALFKRNAGAGNGVDLDAINYATEYTTKMKAKFSYCDQIKFNEPALNPEHQNSSISLTSNC